MEHRQIRTDGSDVHRPVTSAEHTVDPENRQVVVRFGKKVTVKDIEHYARQLRIDPEFQPDFSEIVDFTNVMELDLQASDFLRLADKVDPFSRDAKRAFVVRDAVQSHAVRLHKALRTDANIGIFRSMEAAECWIRQPR